MSPVPVQSDVSTQPLVSVIMASYNYGRFVAEAVQSVLDQSYGHFELLIVDDGSKDDSVAVLERFQDPRITLMTQTNSGQAAAWNRAFQQSRGELILFLDSDDIWRPSKIERMVAWHRVMQGQYSVLQHNLTARSPQGDKTYRRTLRSGNCFEEMRATGELSYFVTSSGLGIPRWIGEKVFPIPQQLRISPDAFLTRVAFLYAPVISTPEELGYLRLHGANAGMTQPAEFHEELRRELIFPALNDYYARHGIDYRYVLPAPPPLWRRAMRRLRRWGG